MKIRILTALIAVFFMLFCNGVAAYAVPEDVDLPNTDLVTEEEPVVPITEYTVTEYTIEEVRPFTPSGTATVTDTATDEDGKEFYTITTPDEHVFYLIIDRQRGEENVYFLNAVTVADLLPLAEMAEYPVSIPTEQPPTITDAEPEPILPAIPEQNSSNTRTIIFIAIIIVVGGSAGWYFKIYRPKQQGVGLDEAEYIPEDDIDPDNWNDDDTLPWDEVEDEE